VDPGGEAGAARDHQLEEERYYDESFDRAPGSPAAPLPRLPLTLAHNGHQGTSPVRSPLAPALARTSVAPARDERGRGLPRFRGGIPSCPSRRQRRSAAAS